ncbi:MAG: hypothetical protein Kow0079_17400 [Vicingaceae bacterium]
MGSNANDMTYNPQTVSVSAFWPFGMLSKSYENGYRYGFMNFEKDDEVYGKGNSYTAEFWQYDPRLGRRWNVDPKPNISISFYAVFQGNPIGNIDVFGDTSEFYNIKTGKLLGTVNDEGSLRRIKIDESIYIGTTTSVNDMFYNGFLSNSSEQAKANYLAGSIISAGELSESLAMDFGIKGANYIAFETGVKSISITGSMRANSSLLADVSVTIKSHFDDNSTLNIGTFGGVAGGFGNGAPENGNYTITNYQDRSPSGWYNSGMNLNGVGFSFNLNPLFNTGRTDLRIHPDGNREGTLGCIGLNGNAVQLRTFRDIIRTYLQTHNSINTNINITNNPNNNGRTGNNIPNIQE